MDFKRSYLDGAEDIRFVDMKRNGAAQQQPENGEGQEESAPKVTEVRVRITAPGMEDINDRAGIGEGYSMEDLKRDLTESFRTYVDDGGELLVFDTLLVSGSSVTVNLRKFNPKVDVAAGEYAKRLEMLTAILSLLYPEDAASYDFSAPARAAQGIMAYVRQLGAGGSDGE